MAEENIWSSLNIFDNPSLDYHGFLINITANIYSISVIYQLGKGRVPKKETGKIVPFWQAPLEPLPPWFALFPRKEKLPLFFLEMNHWCVKRILHLVPSKNLYICFCYISLHLLHKGKNLISARHWEHYIKLHYIKSFCNGIGGWDQV